MRCTFMKITGLVLFAVASLSAEEQGQANSRKSAKEAVQQVPNGTVLPVRLEHEISVKKARSGQAITARLMQEVPLPGGGRIREGTKVRGRIERVSAAGEPNAKISLRFDEIEIDRHEQGVKVTTDLRALASLLEVESAETPETSLGFGTPYVWATTRLVGGGEKYGVGGPVTDEWSNTVGEGTPTGVLVHLQANEAGGCQGDLEGADQLQALWVFSADACGVYGVPGVKIEHAGREEPAGEIVLASESKELKVRSGSGMLLRVIK